MRRKRTRRHLLASEIATGGDTSTEAAELFTDTEQSPDSVKCAIEYTRQWHRDNLLIQTGTILCTAFVNHGLQIKPARGTEMDPIRFRTWWSAHRPAIRRFARETWEDWFTLDNSVAFWRTRSPRVFVLPPEDCTYSDVFGAGEPGGSGDLMTAAAGAGPSAIADLAAKYPWVATVLTVVALCRLLVKPAFTFLHEVVQVTPSSRDDEWLAKVETSRVFGWVVFALDWLCSVKLIHPRTDAPLTAPASTK